MILTTGKLTDENKGFTLIELLIVLGIISAVLSISTFSIGNFLFRNRLETSAHDLAATLRLARRLSITKRREYRVVFNQKEKKYWIEDENKEVVEEKHRLEKNVFFANPHFGKGGEEDGVVEFDAPNNNSFSFYPQGTAEAGSIYLENRDNKEWHTITISPTTGYVKVYSQKH